MSSFFIGILGLVIVFVLAWLIRKILAPKNDFSEFLVGDSGRFSLSRLQATLWAYVIVSYQLSAIILLLNKGQMDKFEPCFPRGTNFLSVGQN